MKLFAIIVLLVIAACGDNHPRFLPVPGVAGEKGDKGDSGSNGTNCSVVQLLASGDMPDGGALVTCGSNTVILKNGAKGDKGDQGDQAPVTSTVQIIASVNPCSQMSGHPEVFLRTTNGDLVAFFTDGSSALTGRLSYLLDNTGYSTTDQTGCTFVLTTSGGLRYLTPNSGPVQSWDRL